MSNLERIIVFCFLYVQLSNCTLSQSDRKSSKDVQQLIGPIKTSVFKNQLVKDAVKWKDIVQYHQAYDEKKNRQFTQGIVLGYVTPWNNHGYDIAKIFGSKFTHISPVWLQLKKKNGRFFITGLQDIDRDWIRDVKRAGKSSSVKVVPRLLFEGWQKNDFRELMNSAGEQSNLIAEILQFLKKEELDGLVFEIWNQLPSADLIKPMPNVISKIADEIRDAGYTFILVIPPPFYQQNTPGIFRYPEFRKLVESVDAFSLMTYDYSSFQRPGPNSPIQWMRNCIEHLVPDRQSPDRAKILMGLNLYGLDHSLTGGSHIFGNSYVEILATYKPKFQYDPDSEEHFFEYKPPSGRHTVFYPTLHSVNERIKLASELGTGLSLWEIGQGLDYFYDLL